MSEVGTMGGGAPLAGIRVLELGSLIAGPFCGQLLADFGAEVIKVEDPGIGDPMRSWGHTSPEGHSYSWPIISRGKKSITCNLRDARGQDLVRKLAMECDVIVENFRPGTLERWGLDPKDLERECPGLVVARVTGYGQDGPYAPRAGFGSIGEAMGGIRYITGEPDASPSRVGISLGDSLAGTFAALGVAFALVERHRSGQGQVIDVAIFEAVLALMEATIPEWALAGVRRERSGAILPGVAPSNVYRCRDGAEILIAANRDTVFARLAQVIGAPELCSDDHYATHEARGRHQHDLDRLIDGHTRTRDSDELLEALHRAGVPAGRVYTAADMLADEHFAARRSIISLEHDDLGSFPMQNITPRLSRTPGQVSTLGPRLGGHNEEIYGRLLQMAPEQVEQLRLEGVV